MPIAPPLAATSADDERAGWTTTQNNLVNVLRTIGERTSAAPDYVALADAYGALASLKASASLKDSGRDRGGHDLDQANRAWALGLAGEFSGDRTLLDQAAAVYRTLPSTAEMPTADRVFHILNFSRALFLAANAGSGDAARLEAIAVVDGNWPLIQKQGSAEQRVNALIDRANLIYAVSYSDPKTFTPAQVEEAFARPASEARATGDPRPPAHGAAHARRLPAGGHRRSRLFPPNRCSRAFPPCATCCPAPRNRPNRPHGRSSPTGMAMRSPAGQAGEQHRQLRGSAAAAARLAGRL
jgi:hypothetical protein